MKNYFSDSETECHCGCGTNNFSKELLDILNNMRKDLGGPIILTSACRCSEYNSKVSKHDNSAHVATKEKECVAADIYIKNSAYRYRILSLIHKYGIKRYGIYQVSIHIDISKTKSQEVTWYRGAYNKEKRGE